MDKVRQVLFGKSPFWLDREKFLNILMIMIMIILMMEMITMMMMVTMDVRWDDVIIL